LYISDREQAQIEHEFNRSLTDVALLIKRSDVTGSFGEPIKTYTTTKTYAAGFAFSPFKFRGRERADQVGEQVSEIFVRARFPYSARGVIEKEDRIALIKKMRHTIDPPEMYEVQGVVEMTIAGLIVNLRQVEL